MTNAVIDFPRSSADCLMRLKEVLRVVPISRTTFYRWIKEDKAPSPIKAGPGISLWRRSEIEAMVRRWENER
ncbi:AlpA family phage regulatory protein [Methylobacterium sp. J-026]|uniref:helix-turn-helix transcriptional regulator n=1 Tax=Methylobacterium sp. J-026 TaxID=2836624 RepID=UPI001FBA03C0|nr:AlpA family phage regulatory protein [Methylobacterium sp. J-026]MCJ2137422.1 AlpA family phage regulatory protein [Methylobacterium sp. J-026]